MVGGTASQGIFRMAGRSAREAGHKGGKPFVVRFVAKKAEPDLAPPCPGVHKLGRVFGACAAVDLDERLGPAVGVKHLPGRADFVERG